MLRRPLSLFFTAIAIAVFFIYEVHSPLAAAIFVCGLVARRQFYKLVDVIDGREDDEHGWMFQHAKEWAAGRHPVRDPLKCGICLRRLS